MPNHQDHDDSQDTNKGLADTKMNQDQEPTSALTAEQKAKTLAMVVCICKGINLGRVIKGMEGCSTVAEVNQKVGTGSGGCQGERCGPRIKILLKKKQLAHQKKES